MRRGKEEGLEGVTGVVGGEGRRETERFERGTPSEERRKLLKRCISAGQITGIGPDTCRLSIAPFETKKDCWPLDLVDPMASTQ